jgi:predicted outer membrane repeat protein
MSAPGWTGRFHRLKLRGPCAVGARPDVLPLEARVLPAGVVFTVNSFTDGVDAHPGDGMATTSDGRVTLRSAIMEANALGGATINVPTGAYRLTMSGANEDAAATGDLDILAPIAVQGITVGGQLAGPGEVTIQGDGSDRIFDIRTNQAVTIKNMTVSGGTASMGGALLSGQGSGLELDDMRFTNNVSFSGGGAVAGISLNTSGQILGNNLYFQGNSTAGAGGAILMDGETLILSGATFDTNHSESGGGAIAVIDSQSTHLGGAQITRTTFTGNSSSSLGGAVYVNTLAIARLTDTTATLNSASTGGGFYRAGGTLGFGNTIVAGNTASSGSPDVFGTVSTQGHNLVGDGTGASGFDATDMVGTAASPINAKLSGLSVRGGTLPVIVPGPGSPAIDTGASFSITDERGITRPSSGADIGAVETQAFGISSTSGGQHAAAGTAFGPLQATVTEGGQALPGVFVIFTEPDGGPGGSFAGSAIVATDHTGVATAPTFTANSQAGSYTVRASASATLFTTIALTNDPALTDTLSLSAPPSVFVGVPFQVTVTAKLPGGGGTDVNYAGTISLSLDGQPGQTYTFTQLDQGQHTFTLTVASTGSHTVTASDPNLPTAQASFTAAAAPTDTLALVAPSPVTAGDSFQLTITANKPGGGGRDFGYTGTVTLSTNATISSLPSDPLVFTLEDQGQKTITVSIGIVGQYFIQASDPKLPLAQVNVNVTPVTNRFVITAPKSVNEGEPFSISISAVNSDGGHIGFVGPVTISSDDPRANIPTTATFTPANEGTLTLDGLSLRPPGPRTITVTAADGTVGQVTIDVVNFGPSELALKTDHDSITEGSSLGLSGTFTNPDPFDTHTVDIQWGDGSHTSLSLGAGVFSFQATHPYTDDPAGPEDRYSISVTVTDAAGGTTETSTGVTVTNVAPTLPASGGGVTANQGSPLGQTIAFTDPGSDVWTVTADFGDGSAPQNVPVGPGRTFTLNYAYKTEGTFTIHVTLKDDDGGSAELTERAVVFLPGTTGIKILVIPAGQTGTLQVGGATVTLSNLGGTTPAILLVGLVDLNSLKGLSGSPTNDSSQLVSAYDIRVLDAGPDSKLTAQLTYPDGTPNADPVVQYYDKAAGSFETVSGSTKLPNSFVVDKTKLQATFILGDTSNPKVSELGGTVFTLAVPAPAPTSPSQAQGPNTSPFLLAASAVPGQGVAGIGDAASLSTAIPTTGLVSSSTLTVAVSASEGLRRGGGDESLAGRLVTPQTLSTVIEAAKEIRDFILEALHMWSTDPAPMEAPAAVLPTPDTINQIQLRHDVINVAATTAPAAYEVVPLTTAPEAGDVVVAAAESHPWWLKPYEHRAETEEVTPSDTIPIPPAKSPTDGDHSAAAMAAIWIGGSALAAVIEPTTEEEEEHEWRPLSEAEED